MTLIKDTYCWNCRRRTHFVKEKINHLLWCILSIACGFPIFIWAYKGITNKFRCNTCQNQETK